MDGASRCEKPFVGESLRRDEQDVHLVAPERPLDLVPLILIAGVDGARAHTHALGSKDLIAHQRQQRRDQQRRSQPALAQQLRRNEVDEALAPAGLLHHEQAPGAFDDMADRSLLAVAECGIGLPRANSEQPQGTLRVVPHAIQPSWPCSMSVRLSGCLMRCGRLSGDGRAPR